MPELKREKLKALCDRFTNTEFVDGLRTALEIGESGFSTSPIPISDIRGIYRTRAAMNEKRGGLVLGLPNLVEAIDKTTLSHISVSSTEHNGYWFAAFTDTDFLQLIAVLRGPVTPRPNLAQREP